MGSKSKSYVVGYQYFWGLHVVPCAAPIDGIVGFEVDSRSAWEGFVPLGAVKVDALQLFGGQEREGGVGGHVDIIDGKVSTTNDYLQTVLRDGTFGTSSGGANSAFVSAFRGAFSVVFRTFYWGNLPRQKKFSFRLRNIFSTAPVIDESGLESPWLPGLAPVCPEFAIADVAIHIAMDNTGSMVEGTRDYDLRNAIKNFINNTLAPAAAAGTTFALRIQPFNDTAGSAFERIPFTTSDVAAAVSFVDNVPAPNGFTFLETGVESAQQFYNDADSAILGIQTLNNFTPAAVGSNVRILDNNIVPGLRRMMVFISDGQGTNAPDTAKFYIDRIPGIEVHGLGLNTIGDLALFDNTGGVVVTDGSANSLAATIAGPWMSYADLNGVHILRHILIGTNAGGTGDHNEIGASFAAAAATCYNECMGLTLFWDKNRMTRDEFRKLVESHVGCRTRFDEQTGKWEIKLIRNDYVKASLPTIDKSQIVEWLEHKDPQQAELPNKVFLNYTDRYTGQPRATSDSNTAALLSSNAPREESVSVTYEGITHPPLAEVVLNREMMTRTRPIRSGTIRLAYLPDNMNEGEAFVLDDDRFDIISEVCRVEEVEDVGDDDASVIIRFTRDVYDAEINAGTGGGVVGRTDTPTTGMLDLTPLNSTVYFLEEMSYYDLVFLRGQSTIDSNLASDDGYAHWQMSGNQPNTSHTGAQVALLTGTNAWTFSAIAELMPVWTLLSDVSSQADDTVFAVTSNNREAEVGLGDIVQINNERMRVDSITVNSQTGQAVFIVGRGVLDTVPAAHSAGDIVKGWDGFTGSDIQQYTFGQTISARFLTRTLGRQLDINSATTQTVTMDRRAIRPYPVGKLQVNNFYAPPNELTGTVTVSWAHRNRLTQTSSSIQDHTDSNITPESGIGLTLVARILDAGMNVQYETTSSIGSPETTTSTTFNIDANLLPQANAETLYASIGVRSSRSGYDNWQTPFVTFPYHPLASPGIAPVPVDPYFENVAFLYRFNQAAASTTLPGNDGYVTISYLEHMYQTGGSATYFIDTTPSLAHQSTVKKHYATALDFRPATEGAEISSIQILPNNQDAYPAQSEYGFRDVFGSMTIEAWIYPETLSESPHGPQVIFSTIDQSGSHALERGDDQGIYWYFRDDGSVGVRLFSGVNGLNINDWISEPGMIFAGQWQHVAVERNGTRDWTVFVDGQIIGSFTQPIEIDDGDPALGIFLNPMLGSVDRDSRRFRGYFDSFRWTLGAARYNSATFTPIQFWEPSLLPSPASPVSSPTPPAADIIPVAEYSRSRTVGNALGAPGVWVSGPGSAKHESSNVVYDAFGYLKVPAGATIAVVTARMVMETNFTVEPFAGLTIEIDSTAVNGGRNEYDDFYEGHFGVSAVLPVVEGSTIRIRANGKDSGYNVREASSFLSVRFY